MVTSTAQLELLRIANVHVNNTLGIYLRCLQVMGRPSDAEHAWDEYCKANERRNAFEEEFLK